MRSFVLSLALAALILPARAQDAAASPSLTPTEKKASKDSADDGEDPIFQFPVAEGVPIKGLKIPQYGPDGKLSMMFDAEVAQKIDAGHIEMENLRIDSYGEDGNKMVVELPKSIFVLEERLLKGDSGVTVKRDDFEVTGKAGEFYTKTRFAKVLGNVKMIIYNTENLDRQ